jgi:predicted MFS family arabinose efflux permease
VCAFAVGFSTAVVVIVVPQLAALPAATGYGHGYSTTRTGLLLLPIAVCSIAAAWFGGRVVDRTGPRTVMAAGAVAALAAYVSLVVAHGSAAAIAGATGALGVAVGLTVTAIASVVVRGAGLDKTSVAVAVNAIVRTTGTAAGAATAAVITASRAVGPVPAESGYTGSFAMGAIAAGCALLASALLPGRPAPGSMASHPEEALPLGPPA